jgi:PIN domain nuclease of toxin-antitoxin system
VAGEMSGLLLDSHILLWLIGRRDRLGIGVEDRLRDPDTTVVLSSATVYELALKAKTGKLKISMDIRTLMKQVVKEYTLLELPVSSEHSIIAGELELFHKDPFDRLLIAQAISDDLTLVTADNSLKAYQEKYAFNAIWC